MKIRLAVNLVILALICFQFVVMRDSQRNLWRTEKRLHGVGKCVSGDERRCEVKRLNKMLFIKTDGEK